MCMYVCVCLHKFMYTICADACEGLRASDPLEVERQAVVSGPMWVKETESPVLCKNS